MDVLACMCGGHGMHFWPGGPPGMGWHPNVTMHLTWGHARMIEGTKKPNFPSMPMCHFWRFSSVFTLNVRCKK